MRQSRSSGSVEGVMGNHDSYSDEGLAGEVRRLSPVLCPARGARSTRAGEKGRS
jgi:hypothetical protein